MPVKRRKSKQKAALSPGATRWLRGEHHEDIEEIDPEEIVWYLFESDDELAQTWRENADWVLAEWIAENPGTRPEHWWRYDAPRDTSTGRYWDGEFPEPRIRLGGTGQIAWELLAIKPMWPFGIPGGWITQDDVRIYRDGLKYRPGDPDWPGVAVDPNDPPIFESEATYLDRHGLFLPGEKRRIPPDGWEPEAITL